MNVHLVRSVLRRSSVSPTSLNTTLRRKIGLNGTSAACFSSLINGLLSSSSTSSQTTGSWSIKQPGNHHVRRAMSSTDDEPAGEELPELLVRELKEEEENGSTTMPSELTDLKTQIEANWRVVDGDGATTKLVRKEGGPSGKIAVVFHCQDTVGEVEEDDYDDEEDEGEQAVAVRFTVTTTKAGKTMVLTCTSEDAEARVESVAMTEADAESVATNGLEESLYQGPEFSELAEDVQEAFHKYVQTECGVDGDLAAFISMYSDYKEQVEYVRWLKQVQEMLQ